MQAAAHQHEPLGLQAPAGDRLQQDLRAGVVAADQRPRPEHVGGEAGHHLGEPVERVGVARAILGVAVQRQVGEHDAEAVGELLDGRLELLVGEHRRVQQRERRAGAELPVGHARAVGVVVETQPHTRNRRTHVAEGQPALLRLQRILPECTPPCAACRPGPSKITIST